MKKTLALAVFTASVAFGNAAANAASEQSNLLAGQLNPSFTGQDCRRYLTSCMISPALCQMLYEACIAHQNG